MENQSRGSEIGERTWEAEAPALEGISGRMRLQVGGKSMGVLAIDDGHLSLTDDDKPADVTVTCATRADLVKLLRGELNPVVASLRGIIRHRGDSAFGARVILGLRAGSPFVHTPFDGKDT
jgi:putative sterol carrier protein